MPSFDVAIAGGGPAGLAAAATAARRGLSVAVFEQNKEIGSPIRTSGGSFLPQLRALGLPDRLSHPLSRLRFLSPHSEAVIDYPSPELCVLDIRSTYQFLAEQAIDAGASLRTASPVTAPLLNGSRVTGFSIRTPRNETLEIHAALTLDASGHRAALARAAGLHPGFRRFGVGAEYDLYAPHCDPSEALLLVGSHVAPTGYAWIFPWGNKRVRVGVGLHHGAPGDSTEHPLPYLDRLLADAPRYRVNLRGAQPLEYHHGLIPAEGLAPALSADGLLTAGDAAGQASALVGEGIRWAIQAGRLAGEVAADAIAAADTSAAFLSRYDRQWTAAQGASLDIAHWLNRRMTAWDDEKWDRRVAMLQNLSAEHFTTLLRSEFSPRALGSLLWRHPGLWQSGFRELAHRLGLSPA